MATLDVNKAILEADMTTPATGRDESADLFFSQLDDEAADKAAAKFNAKVNSAPKSRRLKARSLNARQR